LKLDSLLRQTVDEYEGAFFEQVILTISGLAMTFTDDLEI